MSKNNNKPTADSTAFESNQNESIIHLDLDSDAEDVVENIEGTKSRNQCKMCGSPAVWFTAELRTDQPLAPDSGQLTRFWCNDCVPNVFVQRWKRWPWTPDDQLEEYSPPSCSDTDTGNGLSTQQTNLNIVCHLDLESNSSDVTGMLTYAGLTRDEAVCRNCEARADWYHGEIHDPFRAYDFDAARSNVLLCDNCIDPDLVEMWRQRPWTPSEELNRKSENTEGNSSQ